MIEPPSEVTETSFESYAAELGESLGAERVVARHDTVRIYVDSQDWVQTIQSARDNAGLEFFSWLSAIDWSRDVAVGDPVENPEELEERIEVICRLSSVENGDGAHFVSVLDIEKPAIDSLVPVFAGAEWHEREATEMFGISFTGLPNTDHLYLPDSFEGNPLRKSYALLARAVKPWPGDVDVEAMPDASGEQDQNEEQTMGEV